ncbi:30S ribosomal protein S8 [Thermovibrio ammonificans]|jgi:small subunit ribosomal protein S8|uniref:Small ribosomal subunit protein uS8 n=1 Tax=Thermovibrio ammonificans (strain DSM 15698 / JCM 12110 / HB-1) TaxID=648996 RepID=E8T4A9_THEA1|nr:30S ribosomal protein S8 [Thermovibrio ammonificans]ADU96244.1 ribosomal protein S8 [Thermovibrio ammonificans HB-1]
MMMDTVADFLARIRNANLVYHETVEAPYSKVNEAIAKILKEEGFIKDYEVIEVPFKRAKNPENKKKVIRVHMKYGPNKERVINEIKRVSKPGRRIYVGKDEIPLVKAGLGVAILSTNKGIIPGYKARKLGVGGEVLCYVW